jgi:hypothetical protein
MTGDRTSRVLCGLLLAATILPHHSRAPEARRIKSPDGNRVAIIVFVGKDKGFEDLEFRLEIRDRAGKTLFTKSFSSEDGEHGYNVVAAKWTDDSQFFVFSMASSGGYELWHYPSFFYSPKTNQLVSLDESVDLVTDPNFKLTPEDTIRIEINYQAVTVDLEELAQRAKPH